VVNSASPPPVSPHGRHLDRTLGEVSKGAGGPCERLDGEAPAARSVFAEHGVGEGE